MGENPSALCHENPSAQQGEEAGSQGKWPRRKRKKGNLGWWGWRTRRRSTRRVLLGQEDLQGQPDVEQRLLITEESGPPLVLIQPWEQEKHVRKMKVAF